ncbi:MAG: hypothetical protein FWD67_09465, partial [Betaproteobacteria bacterium]|nr:hypothetical protein [Betaproteobacteria bacterium]
MPKKSLKFIFLTSIIFLLLIISPFVFFDIPKNNHRILGIMLHISYYLLVCAIFLFFEKKLNTKFKALTGSILIPLLIMSLIYITVSMVISPERIFTIDTFD